MLHRGPAVRHGAAVTAWSAGSGGSPTARPEVRPVAADGTRLRPGGRRARCPSSPVFREHVARPAQAVAERYGQHRALAVWHVVPALHLVSDAAAEVLGPGAFRAVRGVRTQESFPLLAGEATRLDDGSSAPVWTELVHLEGAEVEVEASGHVIVGGVGVADGRVAVPAGAVVGVRAPAAG